jgi:hypothetical protein
MSYHFAAIPAPADQVRVDGWSPPRQRHFLEVLAATGVIRLACEAVRITQRSAYVLRIRADGAAFRLGWDAAILIARARLADTLLARAITGTEETVRKDEESGDITRHRHDNRLAMSMLARLDRMADTPVEGSDAALARVVAQDFAAYLDLICPAEAMAEEAERHNLPRTGAEPSARAMDDARLLDGTMPDTPEPPQQLEQVATALSPGASAALFIAARMALRSSTSLTQKPHFLTGQERCELPPAPPPKPAIDLTDFPPEEAAARLRGVWWDESAYGWRTDFPPPPDFEGEDEDFDYHMREYERELSPDEEDFMNARHDAAIRPYEQAAASARDRYFGLASDAAPG